jgi:hypothetical protein
LWESGNFVSECGVVHLIDKNLKEGGGLVIGIRLKFGVNLNDKGGGDRRE